ncbi:MAG: hypothetical protein ACI9F9_003112 [Candidatus Paceibacteria bacterium]
MGERCNTARRQLNLGALAPAAGAEHTISGGYVDLLVSTDQELALVDQNLVDLELKRVAREVGVPRYPKLGTRVGCVRTALTCCRGRSTGAATIRTTSRTVDVTLIPERSAQIKDITRTALG